MEQSINGNRIKQVRELMGLNQTELAVKLNITQPSIALLESGRIAPSDTIINQMAFISGFPVSFFKQLEQIDVPLGSLLFRHKRNVTVKEKNRLYRYAQTLYELTDSLLKNFKSPPTKIPLLSNTEPSEAARLCRSALGISPDKPINNLIDLLEKSGVIILSIPHSSEIDAFSFWVKSRPVIAITEGRPGDRLRLNIAHELGHLVLHNGGFYTNHADLEDEAFVFAAELLVPENSFREELVPPIKLSDFAPLKQRWGVSMQAMIVYAERLNIITKRQYKYLFQQIGINKWRSKEPVDIPIEKPRLLLYLSEKIYGSQVNAKVIAANNCTSSQFVEETLNRYIGKGKSMPKAREQGRLISFPNIINIK